MPALGRVTIGREARPGSCSPFPVNSAPPPAGADLHGAGRWRARPVNETGDLIVFFQISIDQDQFRRLERLQNLKYTRSTVILGVATASGGQRFIANFGNILPGTEPDGACPTS